MRRRIEERYPQRMDIIMRISLAEEVYGLNVFWDGLVSLNMSWITSGRFFVVGVRLAIDLC